MVHSTYLEQQLVCVFGTVEQICCSHHIPGSFVFPSSVKVRNMQQYRKQRVDSDPTCDEHQVGRGVSRLWIKEEVASHSQSHFRVKSTLRRRKRGLLVGRQWGRASMQELCDSPSKVSCKVAALTYFTREEKLKLVKCTNSSKLRMSFGRLL